MIALVVGGGSCHSVLICGKVWKASAKVDEFTSGYMVSFRLGKGL